MPKSSNVSLSSAAHGPCSSSENLNYALLWAGGPTVAARTQFEPHSPRSEWVPPRGVTDNKRQESGEKLSCDQTQAQPLGRIDA